MLLTLCSRLSEHKKIGKLTFVWLNSIPFLGANKVRCPDFYSIPHLYPCVNDNRKEADREYVEDLEQLKKPHLDSRPKVGGKNVAVGINPL